MEKIRLYSGSFESVTKGKDTDLYLGFIDQLKVPSLAKLIEIDFDTKKRTGRYKIVVICNSVIESGFEIADDVQKVTVSM